MTIRMAIRTALVCGAAIAATPALAAGLPALSGGSLGITSASPVGSGNLAGSVAPTSNNGVTMSGSGSLVPASLALPNLPALPQLPSQTVALPGGGLTVGSNGVNLSTAGPVGSVSYQASGGPGSNGSVSLSSTGTVTPAALPGNLPSLSTTGLPVSSLSSVPALTSAGNLPSLPSVSSLPSL